MASSEYFFSSNNNFVLELNKFLNKCADRRLKIQVTFITISLLIIILGGYGITLFSQDNFLNQSKHKVKPQGNFVIVTEDIMEIDIRLKSPFTAMLAGPTGSGKTELIKRLIYISQEVSTPPPSEIIYCYGIWQSSFDYISSLPNVTFHEGMIDVMQDIPNDGKNRWLILDDMMEEISGKNDTSSLFTKHSHHRNISVFFLVQDLFMKGNKTVSRNSHYFFLFNNPRDKSAIRNFMLQAFPGNLNFTMDAYNNATSKPYGYLFIDLTQSTKDENRLIGNYASENESMQLYRNI